MFILYVSLCLLLGVAANQDEEEYALNFDSPVYVCSDDLSQASFDTSEVEVQRYNETTSYLNGYFSFLKQLEPCSLVELIVEKTVGARTEVMVTHEICDICTEMSEDSVYHKYLKYLDFPSQCPFEAGPYKVLDMVADTDDLPINRANEARYQATLNFFSDHDCNCKGDRTFLGCLKLDFVIEPAY